MYNIGILNKITIAEIENKTVGNNAKITCFDAKEELDIPDVAEIIDAAIIFHRLKLTRIGIDKLKNCKIIVCASVGFDNVDIHYAKKRGIHVVNVPDYGIDDVADHTIALFLSYMRRINGFSEALKKDFHSNWNPKVCGDYHRITNLSFGILGLGRIGTSVALRAKAFRMNVNYFDPYKPEGYDKVLQIKKCASLAELISTNNIISIHVPLTDETKYMITPELLEKENKKPIIINTARGAVIKNTTVLRALEANWIEAYLADVMEYEPPQKGDPLLSKFITSERLLITPHSAAYAVESLYEMRQKAIENAFAFLNDGVLRNCINF